MLRLIRSVAVLLSAAALTACASAMTVSSHVDRSNDFTRYRTYDWGPADALPTGDPRLDNNPFFKDHVQGEVEKQLAARGFEGPISGTSDLLIHYHASINQRFDVNDRDSQYGYCNEDCESNVTEYAAGTLVLDIVDARTNKVVWRGWAQDSVEGVLNNQDRMATKIHEAITRMLAMLPPKL